MGDEQAVEIKPGQYAQVIYEWSDDVGEKKVMAAPNVEPLELYLLSHSRNVHILGMMIYEEDCKVYFFNDHKEIASRTLEEV